MNAGAKGAFGRNARAAEYAAGVTETLLVAHRLHVKHAPWLSLDHAHALQHANASPYLVCACAKMRLPATAACLQNADS